MLNKQEIRPLFLRKNIATYNYSAPKFNILKTNLLHHLPIKILLEYVSTSLAYIATGIFAHSSMQNCSNSNKFGWVLLVCFGF